jgi:hypothetical protein
MSNTTAPAWAKSDFVVEVLFHTVAGWRPIASKNTATGPGINLSEEEVTDVSLGTFYVFDKETPKLGEQYAQRGGRGCGGCRGCRGGRGCGGGGCRGCGVAAAACPGDRAASARRDTGGRLVGISLARVSAGLLYALA